MKSIASNHTAESPSFTKSSSVASGSPDSSEPTRLTAPSDPTHPFAPGMTVLSAREEYLSENGFDVAGYTAPTVRLKGFGHYFDFPNTPDRQWAIPLHDLHHLATGFGTDFVGEGEIAIWELRAGCRTPVVYLLNMIASAIGLVLAPSRIIASFRAARGARSLYRHPLACERALAMTVGELRAHLGLPARGIGSGPRHLHTDAEAKRQTGTGVSAVA